MIVICGECNKEFETEDPEIIEEYQADRDFYSCNKCKESFWESEKTAYCDGNCDDCDYFSAGTCSKDLI